MHVLYACMHCNLCIDKHNFLRKTSALIRCFCKLQKVFHHSSSTLVGEIFELSPINRKGGSNWQIDLTATPHLLTPGAPAPLSKSARAPHGVVGHIHGGMAGRQADVQDASPTCLQSLPVDAPAARLRRAGGAAGDSREEMEGAGDADPRRRSLLDPVHARMEGSRGGSCEGGSRGGTESVLSLAQVCSDVQGSCGLGAAESSPADLLRRRFLGEAQDAPPQ